jgi:hypothetical protein
MPTDATFQPFYCGNENRRELVRTTTGPGGVPVLNGMDYLEIANEAQTELEIRFIHPLPGEAGGVPAGAPALTTENIRILGGERIRNIRVLAVIANGERLQVIVDTAGDFSTYTLVLVAGANVENPPPGFDPRLSRVPFSFKAACPTPFDCRQVPACASATLEAPRIDYLARDYETYRRVLLDRMRLLMPQWDETSPADFPVAAIELLAYVGDQLTYAQEATATEAYPGIAHHRESMRRHARFRDYRMHEGCNARTWVQLEVEPGGAVDGAFLPVGTPFFAGSAEQLALAVEGAVDQLDPEKSAVFESMEAIAVRASHNRLEFYTWSDDECALCEGARSATLRRPDGSALEAGMALIFEEIRDPRVPEESLLPGRPDRRWAVRLTGVQEIEDPLNEEPLYRIEWSEADALPFSFVVSRRVESVLISEISVARGNVVLADHGLTVEDDPDDPSLDPVQAPLEGTPYRPILKETGLTWRQPTDNLATLPASQSLRQNPAYARPQVWLDSEGERWEVVGDLLGSTGSAAEFVIEMDNRRGAHFRFGDSEYGRSPSLGQFFASRFRLGNGARGNLGAETVSAILRPGGGFRRVRNPLPAEGGVDPESIEQVRQFAPVAFRTQNRAVTLADYEAVARRHPGVQQAHAEFRWLASWYTVMLAIDRLGGEPLDAEFRAGLIAHLDQYRMAGYDLEIRDPVYVPLDIAVHLCLRPGTSRTDVLRELNERLGNGPEGLFHPDRLTFGQRLFASEIIARAMTIGGVDHVRIDRLKRFWAPPGSELDHGYIEAAGMELFQLANDPSFPERGRIEFTLDGGF